MSARFFEFLMFRSVVDELATSCLALFVRIGSVCASGE
jgi:hypothetical protein